MSIGRREHLTDLALIVIAGLLVLALLLGITAIAHGQTATIRVECPAMPITRLSVFPNLWECSREIGTATATLDDGKVLTFKDFEIPPTRVRKQWLKRYVDACNQFGYSQRMDQLSIDLPREPVRLGVAQAMTAVATLTLIDGTVYKGSVTYPSSESTRTGRGTRLAATVTAVGEVMLP